MNRGEVWWAEDPHRGRRPVCILTRQAAIPVLKSLVAVSATRTIRGTPTELALDRADGMPSPCVLNFDDILTVPKALLTERITKLSGARLAQVCATLRIATSC